MARRARLKPMKQRRAHAVLLDPSDPRLMPVTPAYLASVCLQYPAQQDAILLLADQHRGRAFVHSVLAIVSILAVPAAASSDTSGIPT